MADFSLETDSQRPTMIDLFGVEYGVAMKASSQAHMMRGRASDVRGVFGGIEVALKELSCYHTTCTVYGWHRHCCTQAGMRHSSGSHHLISAFTIDHKKSPTSASS
jgi:hypothetical protein